jgi:hypothetical protein
MANQDYCHKRLSQWIKKEAPLLFIQMGGLVSYWLVSTLINDLNTAYQG